MHIDENKNIVEVNIVNSTDVKKLIKKDKIFKFIFNKYGTPPNWARPLGFESLSKIILEQQVSFESANAHFNKLNKYIKNLNPENILRLTDEEMRNCQISRQKSTYLRALSEAILNRTIVLKEFPEMSEPDIRTQLTNIKGIGNWTADIYLMFCLQSKDIFPIGDIAVVNTVKEFYPTTTKEEITLLAENWHPYRSLAAYFFWHYYLKKRNRLVD